MKSILPQIYKSLLLLIISISVTSCIRELEYKNEYIQKQLVVNALMQANKRINVHVSGLQSILDTGVVLIDDAYVIISQNEFVDTLESIGHGYYESTFFAKEGKIYKLKVVKNGYPTIFATDTIPISGTILNASKEELDILNEDGWPLLKYQVDISFDTSLIQYYEYLIVEQSYFETKKEFQFSFIKSDIEVDQVIEMSNLGYLGYTYFFSSKHIKNTPYTMNMIMQSGLSAGGRSEMPIIENCKELCEAVIIRSVSKPYIEYRRSWSNHLMTMNDSSKIEDLILLPLVGQQQEMYSNIENGKGIFASYTQSHFILE